MQWREGQETGNAKDKNMEFFNYQQWMLDVFSEQMETSYSVAAPLRLFRLFYHGVWKRVHRQLVSVY